MTKRRLLTTFVLGILFLGSLIGIGVNAQPMVAANFAPVSATSYLDALGYTAQVTATAAQTTVSETESEGEFETPEWTTDIEQVEKKNTSHNNPKNGLQD